MVPITARKKKILHIEIVGTKKPMEEMFSPKKNHKNITALQSGVDISI